MFPILKLAMSFVTKWMLAYEICFVKQEKKNYICVLEKFMNILRDFDLVCKSGLIVSINDFGIL
jgi:hypothetical protein